MALTDRSISRRELQEQRRERAREQVTDASIATQIITSGGSSPVQSVAGRTGDVVLAKADVGLANVDDISALNMPISTATQTALDAKQAADAQLTSLSALTFAGNALKVVRLNAGETDFEFGSGSGITRSINAVAVNTTAGATASTDYVYFVSAGATLTLPTAVGNANMYAVKNTGATDIAVASTGGQTFDGTASPIALVAEQELEFYSDGSNWRIA